ncbi:MAG: hypothetical protein AVDCRST_MAG67-2681 [uncultured Solirubrobacteraceae bacterium]|uniref:Uncharacterized protein n=1 Tax=uncultured Solirubrobacteraceae bacterium TaxID=1162706 RepID=A0A6J4T119_9ACTN|nr:MAG: hypothetical protein AVDCRST_MAG67-2681 [uncultured Solirubrobacteraceae bacterium]
MSIPLAADELAGSTDDPWLHGFGEGVVTLAERAEQMTSERRA